jgi:hypothetical protein
MFGSDVDPKYKLKGAESNWFVGFVVSLLEQRGHVLGPDFEILLALGQDLLRLLDLMRTHLYHYDFECPQGSLFNENDRFSDEVRTRQGRAFIRNEVEQAGTNPAYNNDISKQAECSHGMVYKVLQ